MNPKLTPKRLVVALLGVAACIGIGLGTVAARRSGFFTWGSIPFTRAGWSVSAPERRLHMSEDLLANHVRPGMSVTALFDLLGEPEVDREDWTYFLSMNGPGPELGSGGEHAQHPELTVRFRDGIVSENLGEFEAVDWGFATQPIAQPFESDTWLAADFANRRGMAWTIEQVQLFVGRTRVEILDQLGRPDQMDRRYVEYPLGWTLFDPVDLIIEIDEAGLVIGGQVVYH